MLLYLGTSGSAAGHAVRSDPPPWNYWITPLYPCPARRDLPRTHNDFGLSIDCSVAGLAAAGLNAPGDCAMGVCIADSGVDRDGIGGNDWVLIGGFPVTTIQTAVSTLGVPFDFRTDDMYL